MEEPLVPERVGDVERVVVCAGHALRFRKVRHGQIEVALPLGDDPEVVDRLAEIVLVANLLKARPRLGHEPLSQGVLPAVLCSAPEQIEREPSTMAITQHPIECQTLLEGSRPSLQVPEIVRKLP